VDVLVREAAVGSVVGLAVAFVWYFTITKPVQDRIAEYYKK
jgi:hypothetical protein